MCLFMKLEMGTFKVCGLCGISCLLMTVLHDELLTRLWWRHSRPFLLGHKRSLELVQGLS
jgi:hypothetical protein